jgi:hypothetical protein
MWKLTLLFCVVWYVQVNTHMHKLEQMTRQTQLSMASPKGMEIIKVVCSE